MANEYAGKTRFSVSQHDGDWYINAEDTDEADGLPPEEWSRPVTVEQMQDLAERLLLAVDEAAA